jgi:hypothetical protein
MGSSREDDVGPCGPGERRGGLQISICYSLQTISCNNPRKKTKSTYLKPGLLHTYKTILIEKNTFPISKSDVMMLTIVTLQEEKDLICFEFLLAQDLACLSLMHSFTASLLGKLLLCPCCILFASHFYALSDAVTHLVFIPPGSPTQVHSPAQVIGQSYLYRKLQPRVVLLEKITYPI